ncbi:uncharacterized protein LOC112058515 [Bicyclus anynana]|uniref:Uncharacterized protein LOC112058515 n=1 Tax=Bicyclus anynana TaxID=110368 RepID=A0A6J1PBC4_BICAN|nr:uncharacterized protein LOC112058515 [Bicyclus anynana]
MMAKAQCIGQILSIVLFVYVCGESEKGNNYDANNAFKAQNYDEIDPVIDMLLNGEYDANNNLENKTFQDVVEDEPVLLYPDGVWKCGNCTDSDKMDLLYSEVYERDVNYDEYAEELNMEIQIGLSLNNMKCITVKAEEDTDVRIVSGACSGEQATLGLLRAIHCVISVYGYEQHG